MPTSVPSGCGTANTGRPSSAESAVTATSSGSTARGKSRCEPRDGRTRDLAPPPIARTSSTHTPVALTTTVARTSCVAPLSRSRTSAPTTRPPRSRTSSSTRA